MVVPVAPPASFVPDTTNPADRMMIRLAEVVRERRRSRAGAIGQIDWSIETIQRRADAFNAFRAEDRPTAKSLAIGSVTGWTTPGGDRLSLDGRYAVDRVATAIVSSRHLHSRSTTGLAELGWTHRDSWRLAVGYRYTGGGASSEPLERAIDIANGAAIREHGMQATFTIQPMRVGRYAALAIGVQATGARYAAAERLQGTVPDAPDHGLSLFLHPAF